MQYIFSYISELSEDPLGGAFYFTVLSCREMEMMKTSVEANFTQPLISILNVIINSFSNPVSIIPIYSFTHHLLLAAAAAAGRGLTYPANVSVAFLSCLHKS